jgi:hypothetical protein
MPRGPKAEKSACRRHRRCDHAAKMKFKDERPFPTPEAAEQKLLEIANAMEADHADRLSVAVINTRNFEMLAAVLRIPRGGHRRNRAWLADRAPVRRLSDVLQSRGRPVRVANSGKIGNQKQRSDF